MFPLERSEIPLTFIKLQLFLKTNFQTFLEWPFYTDIYFTADAKQFSMVIYILCTYMSVTIDTIELANGLTLAIL